MLLPMKMYNLSYVAWELKTLMVIMLSHTFEEENCNCAADGNIHLLGKSYDLEHRIDLFNMCMQCRVQSVWHACIIAKSIKMHQWVKLGNSKCLLSISCLTALAYCAKLEDFCKKCNFHTSRKHSALWAVPKILESSHELGGCCCKSDM